MGAYRLYEHNRKTSNYLLMKPKKKFKDTLVGKGLVAIASIITPALGNLVSGAVNVGDAMKHIIKDGSLTAEQREVLKNHAHQLEIEEFQAEVADRNSARNREVGIIEAGSSDVMMKVVGSGILLVWAMLLWAVFFSGFELGENRELALIGFGGVTTYVGNIVAYYYGSSMGSKDKTVLMNKNK